MNIKPEANMKELTANSTTSPTNTQHHHQGDIKFRIVHIDAFITVMKILSNFCETVNFEFSSEGLQVIATDGMFDRFTVVRFSLPIQQKQQTLNTNFCQQVSNVVLFKLVLFSRHCLVFQSRRLSKTVTVGVNLKLLCNGLGTVCKVNKKNNNSSRDSSELYLIINTSQDRLTLYSRRNNNSSAETYYTISQFLVIEQDKFDMDSEMKFDVELLLSSHSLSSAISDVKVVKSDAISVRVQKKRWDNGGGNKCTTTTREASHIWRSSLVLESRDAVQEAQSIITEHEQHCIVSWNRHQQQEQQEQEQEEENRAKDVDMDNNNNNYHHDNNKEQQQKQKQGSNVEPRTVSIENSYPMRVLETLTKTSKISDSVLVQMGESKPLSFLYRLDDNLGLFQFFVAPFIETETWSDDDHDDDDHDDNGNGIEDE